MLIRPKLEYSTPIWNPDTFSQVKSLERAQHSAARFVKNDYRRNTNPADLITALGWPTLERRRIIKQATTFYKILNNIIEITPPPPSRPTNPLSNPYFPKQTPGGVTNSHGGHIFQHRGCRKYCAQSTVYIFNCFIK